VLIESYEQGESFHQVTLPLKERYKEKKFDAMIADSIGFWIRVTAIRLHKQINFFQYISFLIYFSIKQIHCRKIGCFKSIKSLSLFFINDILVKFSKEHDRTTPSPSFPSFIYFFGNFYSKKLANFKFQLNEIQTSIKQNQAWHIVLNVFFYHNLQIRNRAPTIFFYRTVL